MNFKDRIKIEFEIRSFIPNEASLVNWDGYDELDKGYALCFFEGKTWEDVFQYLHLDAYKNHEEWYILRFEAFIYYSKAYFLYLLKNLENEIPDDEYSARIISSLYQVLYIHKSNPFSDSQTQLIIDVVNFIVERLGNINSIEIDHDWINRNAKDFFNELYKYHPKEI